MSNLLLGGRFKLITSAECGARLGKLLLLSSEEVLSQAWPQHSFDVSLKLRGEASWTRFYRGHKLEEICSLSCDYILWIVDRHSMWKLMPQSSCDKVVPGSNCHVQGKLDATNTHSESGIAWHCCFVWIVIITTPKKLHMLSKHPTTMWKVQSTLLALWTHSCKHISSGTLILQQQLQWFQAWKQRNGL